MSDPERIAQVAHQKWANEQKTSDSLRKPMSEFPTLNITFVFTTVVLQYMAEVGIT